jgi:amino acid transporter
VSYFVQIAHPSFQFDSVDSAAYEIARNIGGDLFVSIFLIGLIVGQFASGLSAQASGSRLLFAMGRDGVLPKSFSAPCMRASARRSTASCCVRSWHCWR